MTVLPFPSSHPWRRGLIKAALAILVAFALLALASAARGAVPCPNPKRSEAQLAAFKAQWSAAHGARPCPQGAAAGDILDCRLYHRVGRAFVLYEQCGACEVDHICALGCCGLDAPSNMRWLDKHANRAKGADCTACTVTP